MYSMPVSPTDRLIAARYNSPDILKGLLQKDGSEEVNGKF
jgi:hypothetical protein